MPPYLFFCPLCLCDCVALKVFVTSQYFRFCHFAIFQYTPTFSRALRINMNQRSLINIIIISPLVQGVAIRQQAWLALLLLRGRSGTSAPCWALRALRLLTCASRFHSHPARRLACPSPHLAYLLGLSTVCRCGSMRYLAIPPLVCIATRSSNTAHIQSGLWQ